MKNKLKMIMTIADVNERKKELLVLAHDMGISVAGLQNDPNGFKEHILVERIEQRELLLLAQKTWIIAFLSALTSLLSALAAWSLAFF